MRRVFLIHGWGGSPEEGWRPWLKKELEKGGFEVYAPAMPDAEHPRIFPWLEILRQAVGTPDESVYFVGHSLGCITILRYLEGLQENQKVGGVVLVAGFSDMQITVGEDEDVQELQSFFQTGLDFAAVRKHCDKFVAIHSDNDPYVEKGKSHFSGDDGINELPSALESILQFTSE